MLGNVCLVGTACSECMLTSQPGSTAVQEADGCEYIIVLQQGSDLHQLESRPPLPTNARYMEHPNSCFDIGTVGWVLNHEDVVVRWAAFLC